MKNGDLVELKSEHYSAYYLTKGALGTIVCINAGSTSSGPYASVKFQSYPYGSIMVFHHDLCEASPAVPKSQDSGHYEKEKFVDNNAIWEAVVATSKK